MIGIGLAYMRLTGFALTAILSDKISIYIAEIKSAIGQKHRLLLCVTGSKNKCIMCDRFSVVVVFKQQHSDS